jgi:hypothetical protein
MNHLQVLKDRILAHYGEPTDLDDLARCCIAMCGTFNNVVQPRDRRRKRLPPEYLKVVGFAWDIRFTEKVSNSHSRPIDGMDNWCGRNSDKGAPDGYPGFTGRVWMRWATKCNSFISDPMRATLTHTGTGGGGSYSGPWDTICSTRWARYAHRHDEPGDYPQIHCASFDYRIYASDWPLIQAEIDRQRMILEQKTAWAILNDTAAPYPLSIHHKFLWEDPETKAADDAFIAECLDIRKAELMRHETV